MFVLFFFFFFKQKTAYEMRISDWSSDVCSSDLRLRGGVDRRLADDDFAGPAVERLGVVADTRLAAAFDLVQHVGDQTASVVLAAGRCLLGLFQIFNGHSSRSGIAGSSDESRVGKECVSTCESRWWACT